VRRELSASHYSVWDNEENKLAIYEGRECRGLHFKDAFNAADDLNAQLKEQKEKD
jgi:hypothetical protein